MTIAESVSDMKKGFTFIFRSQRLKALLLFMSIFVGVLMMISTYEKSLLKDLNVQAQYFGIIFAMLTLVQCFAVQFQDKIHRKFRNKTLAFLSIPVFVSFIVIGMITGFGKNGVVTIIVVFSMFCVQHFLRAPYWTLENKYMTNFTNPAIRVKILSASKFVQRVARMAISFLAGLLLEYYSTSEAYFIIGTVGLLTIFLVLNYMKKRIGLDPEKYKRQDIEYQKLN